MSQQLDRRRFLGASLLALCIPSKLFAQEQEKEVVLRFAALSDVHYDTSHTDESAERVRFGKALRFMNEFCAKQQYNKFDALIVAGDCSNHGLIEEIAPFKKTMDDNLAPSTRRVLCMGNHEFYGGNRALWQQTFETNANRRQEINGYQFITIAPEKGTCNENDYHYAREWLDQEIQEAIAADPSKPVFVIQHYHVKDTVYGSASLPDDFHAGVLDLVDIFKKYPQVIDISGHSHIPSYDPRSVWQGGFTAIGTGSMSYFALKLYEHARKFQLSANSPYNQAGTFLIFDVYRDNSIRIRLYDTISDAFLDREYLLVDPMNIDKYVYTDKRFENAATPVWSANAKVEALEIASGGARLRFSQANDEYCVVSYRIEALVQEGDEWKPFATYNVWSDYFMKERAPQLEYDVVGLRQGAKYRLNGYGVGAFQKETSEPLALELETPTSAAATGRNDPCPKGDFIDVSFDSKEQKLISAPSDNQNQLEIRTEGAPTIVDDPTLGSAVDLNGKDQCYLIPFSALKASSFQTEVSIAVKFRLELEKKVGNETISIFGSTELGGLGFEYYADRKELFCRCWINDRYEDLTTPFDGKGDAVACFTYDNNETRLYLNGKLVAKAAHTGSFRFTTNETARAFCIGGDICKNMQARWFVPGKIARARVYSWALSQEQVENISKE